MNARDGEQRPGKLQILTIEQGKVTSVREIGYQCQGCYGVFGWSTDESLSADPEAEIKTIANRFCVNCIDAEAKLHGVDREFIIAMRVRLGQAVP